MNKTLDKEGQLIEEATEAFNKIGPGEMRLLRGRPDFAREHDFQVEIEIRDAKLHYFAEVKPTVLKNARIQLLFMKEHVPQFLLVTRYVNPNLADQMKQDGIQFIDTAGNAFMKDPNLFIFVKGNKPPKVAKRDLPPRAFRPAGLKLIFALLCDPKLLNEPYRQIVATADVALGTVAWVMEDLKRLGFLARDKQRQYRMMNQEKLLKRWTMAYGEDLRPKLILGKYHGEHGWWEKAKIDPEKEQWGGEIAAAKLTGYLRPEIATIYTTKENLDDFLLRNRLRKDPNGNVEVLERFSPKTFTQAPEEIVHQILVYADLLATGDPRNIETAKMLYEQRITRFIRED